jgi:multiple sugar transport system permease protein
MNDMLHRAWITFKKHKVPYLFLAPTIISMLILHLFPLVQGILLGFLESNKSTIEQYLGAPWIGLKNYTDLLFNSESSVRQGLWDALRNTFIYSVFVIGGTIIIGLLAAMLVHREFKGRSVARTLLLFSWIVPSYVVGMLWGFMWQQEEGIVNTLIFDVLNFDVWSTWFGVTWQYSDAGILIKPRWLTGENTIWAIVIPTIWRYWPFAMIMFLAGLSSIPKEIYEAAEIDGSGKVEQFFQITLPLLNPVMAVLILNGLITNVYSFNIVIMMFGNGAGFPGKHGDLLMTNIFRNSFQMWNFGVGAAMSTVLMAVMVFVVFIWYKAFREDLSGE